MSTIKTFLAAVALGSIVAVPQGSAASFAYLGVQSRGSPAWELPSYGREVAHRSKHRRTVHITGVITNEGVECTALRGDDGRLYTLAGSFGDFEPGERVRVMGRVAQASFCMQGTTIEVRRIFAAR